MGSAKGMRSGRRARSWSRVTRPASIDVNRGTLPPVAFGAADADRFPVDAADVNELEAAIGAGILADFPPLTVVQVCVEQVDSRAVTSHPRPPNRRCNLGTSRPSSGGPRKASSGPQCVEDVGEDGDEDPGEEEECGAGCEAAEESGEALTHHPSPPFTRASMARSLSPLVASRAAAAE